MPKQVLSGGRTPKPLAAWVVDKTIIFDPPLPAEPLITRKRGREQEAEEERCWLCLCGELDGPLILPCACRGSNKWVHRRCFEEWRRTSSKVGDACRCDECNDCFHDALSIELLRERLDAERADGGADDVTLSLLACELEDQGRYDEAEPLFREALETCRLTLGDRHEDTLASINNVGLLLHAKGDLASAEPLLREALDVGRETLGHRHSSTLAYINNVGMLLQDKGDLAAAEPLMCEALEVRRATLGGWHPKTLASMSSLGMLLHLKGDLTAAELQYRETLEGRRTALGNQHPDTLASVNSLGTLLHAKGDLGAALPLFAEDLEGCRAQHGPEHAETQLAACNLIKVLRLVGEDVKAEEVATRYAQLSKPPLNKYTSASGC